MPSGIPCCTTLSHTQALFKLSVEFRKEETRFLNKIEAQKGIKVGGTMGLVESGSQVRTCVCMRVCVCVCVCVKHRRASKWAGLWAWW